MYLENVDQASLCSVPFILPENVIRYLLENTDVRVNHLEILSKFNFGAIL